MMEEEKSTLLKDQDLVVNELDHQRVSSCLTSIMFVVFLDRKGLRSWIMKIDN